MTREINELEIKGTVDTCPLCGYDDGFHTSFQASGSDICIMLICPQCHSKFDPGWDVMKSVQ